MLVEPEKEPKRTFDPERDISPEERKEIATLREALLDDAGGLPDFADLATFELQLGGQVHMTPGTRKALAKERKEYLQENHLHSFAAIALLELQLGDQVPISPEERKAITARREQDRRENLFFFSVLASLELKLGGRVTVSPEEREAIAAERKQYRRNKKWSYFVPFAILELLLDQQKDTQDSLPPDNPPLPHARKF